MTDPIRLVPAAYEIVDLQNSAEAVTELLAWFRDYDGPDRHAVLSRWARSDAWSAPLMLCEDWQGKVAREADRALQTDLAADSPGRAWFNAAVSIGRAGIHRLLGIGQVPGCAYASAPFRTLEYDERSWIAAAIGEVVGDLRWTHLDIRDVILWDPRTGETRLYGDAPRQPHLVVPDICDDRVRVYSDARAYFAAWAARRLLTAQSKGEWLHPVAVPRDGNLPGILVLGDLHQSGWSYVHAETLIADAGINQHDLYRAVLASRGMPSIEGGSGARV